MTSATKHDLHPSTCNRHSFHSNICVTVYSKLSWAHKLKVQYKMCDSKNHTVDFFFKEIFFCFAPQIIEWRKLFSLCHCSTISGMQPLKKTVAVDKGNTALVREAPLLQRIQLPAKKIKPPVSADHLETYRHKTHGSQPHGNLKGMNVLKGYKTVQRIGALTAQPQHRLCTLWV